VSGPPEALEGMRVIGDVGGDRLVLEGLLSLAVSDLRGPWESGLRDHMHTRC
jgi:hypothetical protein